MESTNTTVHHQHQHQQPGPCRNAEGRNADRRWALCRTSEMPKTKLMLTMLNSTRHFHSNNVVI